MITFAQACTLASAELNQQATGEGFEDADDYNVVMDAGDPPAPDDLVVFVHKSDGKVRQDVYFDVLPKLDEMTPVSF
jgi:hypothetical protein